MLSAASDNDLAECRARGSEHGLLEQSHMMGRFAIFWADFLANQPRTAAQVELVRFASYVASHHVARNNET